MKLSKILQTPKLHSVTIDVDRELKVKAYFHFEGNVRRTKTYASLEIDVELKESDVNLVSHLGIKRYRSWKEGVKYANIYNYA